MKTYDFKIILSDIEEIGDQQCDDLYRSGCDDGTIISREGKVIVRFSRDATSLEEAINSAASNVVSAGFAVEHVEVHCPV